MFFRLRTDGTQVPINIQNMYAGPTSSSCWIIGGGPSLNSLPIDAIQNSPSPKFAINLAGSQLLRPTFWTSYDPTARFHRSIYMDPSVIKFVHRCRSMNLVPESTFKVCESPSTVFFDRNRDTGFSGFPDASLPRITDWQDSMIQAIHIAYRLGFRKLYLAGCEMVITPSESFQQRARECGIEYRENELLGEFLKRCEKDGISKQEIQQLALGPQYHFDESKSFDSAVQTDFHYFRVAQYLRLSRQSISLAGLELISVTPKSRLNDFFTYQTVENAAKSILESVGCPANEETRGLYSEQNHRTPLGLGPMRDFRPHFWKSDVTNLPARTPAQSARKPNSLLLPEIPVNLRENP
ncbi:motility associated factor glycosyltransferase family protein [Thalassoglobus polymorphus]|uniref:Uncharacterized protein n=1 Tax=Thalassoglobus polymorphus TaxID=2527994 RepID=A0A517QPQ7_9PLAN|nr:hypothetical protein [Thalassoglobus polymorphus]QDT33626.1 hypothetical protein Mal48_28800 [Thalassoglobus polymorphus]